VNVAVVTGCADTCAANLIVATARAVASVHRPLLQPLGLTHPQYLVLLALDTEEAQSSTQLGDTVQLSAGTMSPLLTRLEVLGHVHRQRDPASEREREISLTRAGTELLPALWEMGDDVTRTLAAAIASPKQLRSLLQRILTAASAAA
jgi:DNA-binding MarR family transcriptional regulator